MKKIVCVLVIILLSACKNDKKEEDSKVVKDIKVIEVKPDPVYKYGFNLDLYNEVNDTIKSGDTFGALMNNQNIPFSRINELVTSARDTFDVRGMRVNKPYTILTTKDSLAEAKVFIYEKNKIVTKIIDFRDSIPKVYTHKLPIKVIERQVSGVILNNFSKSMDTLGIKTSMTFKISEIYAATIDFFRLQKGDSFKIVFDEKFIKDSISVGYGDIKAMVFNHNNKNYYAYHYVTDTSKNKKGFFDEKGRMLQRQFLKSPIKFQFRISSRFNLRRRIALYGNRVRPHKGTDFPAPQGTPIMATASGRVIESARRGGNGNYVKIKHDKTYSTQYLHMKRRKVKVGNNVRQGDVIGWVGMTGNTSGPHVCYRFWKNGRQVDPFRQKLPSATPMPDNLIKDYLKFIEPLAVKLDDIK